MALVLIILAVYMQAGNHTFFILDKNDHVTDNPYVANGLTGRSILWAFTSVAAFNWHPLTWLSHMTVAQFYGMDPRAHHLANVFIHTASSVVLLLLFLRLTGALWQSAFVAALFALHPMHVESVAWVAERKDVLSALFWFLTLYFYSGYATEKLKPAPYYVSLAFYILGLMSKSMLVTLPIVLLLIDVWPLDRYRYGEQGQDLRQLSDKIFDLILEKIPFFACALVTGGITIYAQQKGGATKSIEALPFMLRIENALIAYLKYIYKTIWPLDLGVLYPLPSSFPLWQVTGSLLILLLISAGVIYGRRRAPYLIVGWFWFLVTLVPVIGLIQVGSQSMADRYSYIPSIGLFIMVAWGGADLSQGLPYRKVILTLVAGAIITTSAALTWRQLGYWRDTVSILRHTLHVTTGNYLVNDILGMTYAEKGDLDAALKEYQTAVRINPNDTKTRRNLGIVYYEKGNPDAAIHEFREVLRIRPDDINTQNSLAVALEQKRMKDGAGK